MLHPDKVEVSVDGWGNTQKMRYVVGSTSPERYEKDPNEPSNYVICSLYKVSSPLDWKLFARKVGKPNDFDGSHDPDDGAPTGTHYDHSNSAWTAEVTDIDPERNRP